MTFQREARPLIAEVHAAALVADDGPDAAASFLSAAPAAACQRLADLWDAAGPDRDDARDSLTFEEEIVLDMVVGTYPPARPDSHPELDLDDLLDTALLTAGPSRS